MPTNKKNYLVKARLSSIKHKRDFLPGEMIDLSHATDEQIADLISAGVIELPEQRQPVAPKPEQE